MRKLKQPNQNPLIRPCGFTSDELIAQTLPTLIKDVKEKAFIDGADVDDMEVLGLIVSKFCKWNAEAITEVAAEALIDSNFDALAADFRTSQAYMHLHNESVNK